MVDAVDLLLLEERGEVIRQIFGRFSVSAKRLLDDNSSPAPVRK